MGLACASQVTLEFLDKNGNKNTNQQDITGSLCQFYSARRRVDPGNPDPVLGSQDWLTDIIVADTQGNLTTMKPTQVGDAYTSGSSREVLVQCRVANRTVRLADCLTLATSSTGATDERGYLLVDRVRVMPGDTEMKPGHSLWDEWEAMKQKLEAMKKELAAKKAKGQGR